MKTLVRVTILPSAARVRADGILVPTQLVYTDTSADRGGQHMVKRARLAVGVSRSGTLLEEIIWRRLPVDLVIADRPCRALDIAARYGVPFVLVERDTYGPGFDRELYTQRIERTLEEYAIDVFAMAGLMTILAPIIFEGRYRGRILNTHPSLLPAFPGARAVEDAAAYGAKVMGCTVHVATAEVDAGEILAQAAVPVEPGAAIPALRARIKSLEHDIYPKIIEIFLLEVEIGAR